MTRRRTDRAVSQLRSLAKGQLSEAENYGVDRSTWDRLTAGERAVVRVFAKALREIRWFEEDLLRLGSEHLHSLVVELKRQNAEAKGP